MTKTSWLSAGLAAGLGWAVLAATPAAAQAPEPEVPVLRGTATTVLPTLPPPTSTLDVVRRRGVLRVGVSTFVPWAMTSKSGELIGFEIDLAKQLAEDLGVTAEFVPAAYPNLLDDLLADRFDIVVSGMAITPARRPRGQLLDPGGRVLRPPRGQPREGGGHPHRGRASIVPR